ncbi:VWA domain-containing protein [Nannocystaceae bacterium ST9]
MTDLASLVFAKPIAAWLTLAVLAAIAAYVWGARQRRSAIAKLGNAEVLARLISSVDPGKRLAQTILVVVAMALLVLALLRPQYGGVAKVMPSRGLDIVLAVDYSKSMLAQDVYPSRSERLEAELTRFIDESGRRGDRVGVVIFAGEARGFPLTSDAAVLQLFLEHADPRDENPGGTAIGKAIDKSIELLVAVRREDAAARAGESPLEIDEAADERETLAEADQIIILLTDGEDTVGDPLKLAERAKQLGIRIYTVGIGSTSGEPVMSYDEKGEPNGYVNDKDGKPVMTRLDGDTLEKLAAATQGEYIHVEADRFGLDRVREQIAELSTAQREQAITIHREEGFVFLLIPALVLLGAALALGERRAVAATGSPLAHLRGGGKPG